MLSFPKIRNSTFPPMSNFCVEIYLNSNARSKNCFSINCTYSKTIFEGFFFDRRKNLYKVIDIHSVIDQ